ncbi:PIG-L family deacetylase [Streptomyces erythrochromogenes]|uniref:PIG-L family deacetylase n=1 Tax=Streptomyces erythrochromogenes TaxID=285574 RepID=UPI00380C0E3F
MSDGHPRPGPTAGDGVPPGPWPGGAPGADPAYGQYGQYGQYAWNQEPQQYHQTHLPHQHQHPEPVREFHHVPSGWPEGDGLLPPQTEPFLSPQAQHTHELQHAQQAPHTYGHQQPQQGHEFQQPYPTHPGRQASLPQQAQHAYGHQQAYPSHQAAIPDPRVPAGAGGPVASADQAEATAAGPQGPRGRKAAGLAREAEAIAADGPAQSAGEGPAPESTRQARRGRKAARSARTAEAAPGTTGAPSGRKAARRARAADSETRGGRRAARSADGAETASQTQRGRSAARLAGQGAVEADTTAPQNPAAGRKAARLAGGAETAPPDQHGRRAARLARRASPQAQGRATQLAGRAEAAPPEQHGRRAARLAGGSEAASRTQRGRRAARSADEAAAGPEAGDGPARASTAPQEQRAGRRAARLAREASPQAQRQGQGQEPAGRGAGRGHRWAGLVKAVALCAAIAATGMLVLRGNEALAGLAAHTPAVAAPPATGAVPDPGRIVQIVAHPDDDLYFMNPDLRYSISAGHPVASVYLTAGEADGINATPAKGATTKPDKPAYAEARQNGIRAAYAKMATGDRTSAWQRTVVPTKGGGHAEVDVLVAQPQVNLVWLQLREAGHGYADVPDSLHGLWNGKVARLESMLSSGTPVKQRFAYSKDQVVQTLVGVLEQYTPTTVRFQDPTPGRYPDTKQYTDHQDHFYGARFVQMATAAYAKDVKDRPHFAVQNYVGYFNGSLPSALDPQEAKEKLDSLDTYAWLDRQNHCGSNAGCGDLKVSDQPAGNRWTDTVNYARGTGTDWLTSDKDHGLWAFKVLDGQVAVWHRRGPVGPWRGPDLLPGTGMDPGAGAVTLKDGRIAVFGTRTSFGARPTDYRREVVYTVQKQPGADGFGEWQSLGTPETADETWTSDISAPAVSVDGTGQLATYVRDGAYGLRGRVQQPDGGWGPWEKLGGEDLHGAPVTATDGAGRRMVLSATSKTVVGWAQPKPGAPLGRVTATGLPDTTLPLTAVGREGGVRLWFRKPGSGNVRTALLTADDGLKVNNMTDLGGLNGFGSVTASGHVLAGRAAGGQLGSEVGPGRPWGRSPLMFVGAPSSTTTGRNMVSLAVVGLDARLYVTSSADAPDAYLAPWQPVGPRNAAP